MYEITYKCKQITKDQTLIEQEIERGTITVEEAINDKRRNVLLQCIGVTENLIPSFISREIVPNTSYLLCTDGFRHVISEEEIFQLCRPKSNVLQDVMRHNLCQLIELNKERGERDNISAIWIQVGSI